MKRNLKKERQFGKISKKVLAATLASSIVAIPIVNTSATTSNSSGIQASLQLAKAVMNVSSKVSILENKGALESGYVEWSAVQGATGYNVYYKATNASDSTYKKLDDKLIRQYDSYFRADAVGLSAGSYVMKIVPIVNGQESSSGEAVTKNFDVKAHVREGFAFSPQSPMKTGSGGYNNDGTVASNAQVVYVTASTVNTVTADVVTNAKGTKTTCKGLVDILAKRQKGYDKTPLIIRMVGEIKSSDISGLNSSGYLQVKGCYNLTFEGVGEDATVYGWGILVRDAHNVEIRNIGLMMFPDDGISLDTGNENIWVHNNDIFYGAAGSDADQVKGDGSTDVKLSDYITLSYNHYYDSGKCSLCGMSDTADFHVTYHHNWFDHSDSRHPRIRVGTVHVYNNYFDGNSKYGVGVTKGSSAFVEANSFRNCKEPMLSSLQGSDIAEVAKGGFSGEDGGMIKAYNNQIVGATRLVYANDNATQFDAYLAKTRNETVSSSYKTVAGGHTYNNFDTSSTMYKYTPDDPANVQTNVTNYAGRVNGGDFTWKFTATDDTDHNVNAALMSKIKSYTSSVVSIGGSSIK
ncbi:pectate lyase [Clostridium sp. SHJSY1]|uniref:pectate lyase family protein n=1 Tax=Clostridium sp. SHJSY1 TaxID=2942483 RepID=UPI002874A28D|nr:pectate lyase [Clostridium sp. SHJSY1]MDS0527989.1 pectate lyase [Clostridium sp. SHJSY1]